MLVKERKMKTKQKEAIESLDPMFLPTLGYVTRAQQFEKEHLEFIPDKHIRLLDGVIIPSVTQILSAVFPNDELEAIPENILASKAEYGAEIHSVMEQYCMFGQDISADSYQLATLLAYKQFIEPVVPKVIAAELTVAYEDRFAGQIDRVHVDASLGDYKTYAAMNDEKKKRTAWQLSLYGIALYKNHWDKMMKDGILIHLPKNVKVGKYDLKLHDSSECLAVLDAYDNGKTLTL
jgi:hypothetical protein